MSTDLLLAVVAVFATVALATGWLASRLLTRMSPERRRLEQAVRTETGVMTDLKLMPDEGELARKAAGMVPRSPKEMGRLRKRLSRAGYPGLAAVAVYTAAQVLLPLLFGLLPLLIRLIVGPGVDFLQAPRIFLLIAIFAALGAQMPQTILQRQMKKRQKVIENGLPDALDLLIVCLEAGSPIDLAIVRVSDELALAYPALSEELRLVNTETRAGKRRVDAFRSFAERTSVEDVRALVAMLVQTDRFGTSIAQALRIQADTSRTKRRQRAEERAAKIGVKLVFPLVLFLFPAFFVVVLGPAAIEVYKVFFQGK
jgi:tight adherence protein C